jgi:hypothetical protein
MQRKTHGNNDIVGEKATADSPIPRHIKIAVMDKESGMQS